jgi:hypothetical protein
MDRPRDLPFDSPNWRPLIEAHAKRTKQVGDRRLAARNLTEKMRAEQLPSMRRRIGGIELCGHGPPAPECILLSDMFWRDHELDSWSDRLFIVPNPRRSGMVNDVGRGFVFYYWEPAYREIWPDEPTIESSQPAQAEVPDKGGANKVRLQRQIAQVVIDRCFPNGAPDTAVVRAKIKDEWKAECSRRLIDPTSVDPPSWHTVNRMLERE